MKGLLQAGLLLGLALLCSLVAWAVRPGVVPWSVAAFEIDLATARSWDDALWVDARLEEDFERGTYPAAVSVNEENWEEGFVGLLDQWAPGQPIVVFCSSQSCLRSHHVAERLRAELGVEEVYSLRDGWEALLEAGLVENGSR